ncbi:MAG: hypothetical protein AABX66_03625 [Nanoarchaeota archaeon]
MFKTDSTSLEILSFAFNEQDIARLNRLLGLIRAENLSTVSLEELTRLEKGLIEIERLKLEGKVYGFHIDDSYAARQGDSGEGVELYLRQGDTLKEFMANSDRDSVLKVDQVIPRLKKKNISTIYTGCIPTATYFLGIPYESDPDDPLIRTCLKDYEIEQFKSENINVITLDTLL